MQVKFSNWQIRNLNYWDKGINTWRVKEKILERVFEFNGLKLSEAVIIDFQEKDVSSGEKEYKRTQQHLIGYHFMGIVNSKKDIFWIQGNIKGNGKYAVFSEGVRLVLDWTNKKKAFEFFKKELKERYSLDLSQFASYKDIKKFFGDEYDNNGN